MDHPIDERGGARRVGEHRRPIAAAEGAVDEPAIDRRRPAPVEVDHRLEAAEVAVGEATLEAALDAGLLVEVDDVLEQLRGAPPLARREGDEIVEPLARGAEAELAEPLGELSHEGPPSRGRRA